MGVKPAQVIHRTKDRFRFKSVQALDKTCIQMTITLTVKSGTP